jgi:sulfite reductase (NADPH) flavoprotein alpha-component
MAAGAAAMLMLALSGAALVARRTGGWRRWFAPCAVRSRAAACRDRPDRRRVGFVLSATALWMTASTFDLLPDGACIPADADRGQRSRRGSRRTGWPRCSQTPVAELRELSFPYPATRTDAFTLKTDRGTGYLDQGDGELLAWADLTGWERVSETIYMLHTGQGAATLGLVLGLMALGVPAWARRAC